jgi:hypothetical protein
MVELNHHQSSNEGWGFGMHVVAAPFNLMSFSELRKAKIEIKQVEVRGQINNCSRT